MILTRRVSGSILRWLPNELLSEIISFSSPAAKLSLCRVSKLFHELAAISLYRVVMLQSYKQLHQFWESLSENSTRARSVRIFTVTDTIGDLATNEYAERLDYNIFSTMDRLEILEFEVSPFDTRYMEILRHCTFPRLSDFKYIAPISTRPIIESFLGRHHNISRLIIGGLDTPATTPARFAPLSKLRYYVGPTSFMDFFPSGINQILLLWTLDQPDIDGAFVKLAPLTEHGTQLTFSSLYIRDPAGAIFTALAQYLPHTECIQLRSVENKTRRLEPEYIDAVVKSLGRFTALRYLALEFLALLDPVRDPMDAAAEEYTVDKQTVEKWGRSCPSLRECCFHGSAWRLLAGQWTPIAESDLRELGYRKY
ncbi:hypothetical protein DFH07DRAFT_846882 [Mycena maculata]|uniref:F-box domain-containing protein n=1 Tax=Mycena maculata TaxID=230809 RepID=A0AAD7I145_9AGAR|nr:hypothetical protein DFH07DRAFT_846882 [Mycena maculata]